MLASGVDRGEGAPGTERLLTGIVDGVGQQSQEAGSLDGPYDLGLLLPRSSGASRGVDLPDGIQEAGQHVEALVVDVLEF